MAWSAKRNPSWMVGKLMNSETPRKKMKIRIIGKKRSFFQIASLKPIPYKGQKFNAPSICNKNPLSIEVSTAVR
jgi:hypothetical protein